MLKRFISLAAVAASIFGCSGSDTVAADDGHIASGVKKGTMTDPRDGHKYKTVKIGTQTWMAENLNYDPGDVSDMGIYAWSGCYDDDPANCQKYGRLYTWEVAVDNAYCAYHRICGPRGTVQGVCPSGWHLPTKEEWQQLVEPMASSIEDDLFDIYNGAGVGLKTVDGWYEDSESIAGTNASGFSALPAGSYDSHDKKFRSLGRYANFWSSTEGDSDFACSLNLIYDYDAAGFFYDHKYIGNSVRCLQD